MRPKPGEAADKAAESDDKGYIPVKQPAMLVEKAKALVADNDYGFRTLAEFVATCIRDGLKTYAKRKP